VKPLPIYLDTHIVAWLAQGLTTKISEKTLRQMDSADLLVSPIVQLELEYLFEIKRIEISSRDILLKVEQELNIRVCNFPFATIAKVALDEKWTRDVFDRIIVAHAKSNAFSSLVSTDDNIQKYYPKTIA
jgi:PIN domain nuclease of toxin-antitoxin system